MIEEGKVTANLVGELFRVQKNPKGDNNADYHEKNDLELMIIEQEPMYHTTKNISDPKHKAFHYEPSGCGFRLVQGSLRYPFLGEEALSQHEEPNRKTDEEKEAEDRCD